MDALLMAGGRAARMGGGEKPLAPLKGKPLIAYVLDALLGSRQIGRTYVALSPRVPETARYITAAYRDEDRIATVSTPGAGYLEDTAYAVEVLGLYRPFLILSADLPLVTSDIIDEAASRYEESGAEALSVRVDASRVPAGIRPDTVLADGPRASVPAGINIIDGRLMDRDQQELVLLAEDGRLAANVNYPEDLAVCERLMDEGRRHR